METLTQTPDPRLAEITQLALAVKDYQNERNWSATKLEKEISQIGSTKTFGKILEGDFTQMDIDKQLRNYRGAVEYIDEVRKRSQFVVTENENFTNVTLGLNAIARAFVTEDIDRFVAISGRSGAGKNAIINAMMRREKYALVSRRIEVTENCRHNVLPFYQLVARALNERGAKITVNNSSSAMEEAIVSSIGSSRVVLLLNEMHHAGPRVLNIVKTFINACPRLIIVGFFHPTLLKRLMINSYEESEQLMQNRLTAGVELPAPPAAEIRALMEASGITIADAKLREDGPKKVAEFAPRYGLWRFVVKYIREARRVTAETGGKLDFASHTTALADAQKLCIEISGSWNKVAGN